MGRSVPRLLRTAVETLLRLPSLTTACETIPLLARRDAASFDTLLCQSVDPLAAQIGLATTGAVIIAARHLAWIAGPMSGLSHEGVDAAFFKGTQVRSNLIWGLGCGKTESLYPRGPRLSFEDANTYR